MQVYRVKKISVKFIYKLNESLESAFWRRKSTESTDFEVQRRASDDIFSDNIVTYDEKTGETSLDSMSNLHSNSKVTVFENHNAQYEMDCVTLDLPYHLCNTDTNGGQLQ